MAFVQANSGSSGGSAVASLAVAFSSNNTGGNFLVAVTREPFGSGTSFSVTDSQNNSGWTKVLTYTYNGSDQAEMYVCANCKGGANTVTLKPPTGTAFMRMVIGEYSDTTQAFDQKNHGTGTGTNVNSNSITPTNNTALLLAFVANSVDSSTLANLPAGWSQRSPSADGNVFLCDFAVTSGGARTFTAAYSNSGNWGAAIVSFTVTGSAIAPGKGGVVVLMG